MKTYTAKIGDVQPQWHVIDASEKPLGRLASEVAQLLKGKHKPLYSPHLNLGDFVIVVNSSKVRTTGKKAQQKVYYRHSGYPGGLKAVSFSRMLEKNPNKVIEKAIKGMLPHNALGAQMMGKLKVYTGDSHPHEAQVKGSLKAKESGVLDKAPKIKHRKRKKGKVVAEELVLPAEAEVGAKDTEKGEEAKPEEAPASSEAPVAEATQPTETEQVEEQEKQEEPKLESAQQGEDELEETETKVEKAKDNTDDSEEQRD